MKRLLLVFLLLSPLTACSENISSQMASLASKSSLTAAECRQYETYLKEKWLDSVKTATSAAFETKSIKKGSYTMRLDWTIFGENTPIPKGSRPPTRL